MIRRHILRGLIGATAGAGVGAALSGCSPLALLNTVGPRDAGVRRVAQDLPYGDHPRQRFDVYAPDAVRDGAVYPTIVFFYGGGWESGSKAVYGWAAQALAAQGFVVAMPDYRLVPEVHFPAFIQDAAAATTAVADQVSLYGGEAARLGVMGHSAGAYLALMITLDRRYMSDARKPVLIKACVGLSGPYDFLPFAVPAAVNAFGRAPDPLQTQPVAFARADAAPVWLAHGTADETVEPIDTTILDDRLRAAGGLSQTRLYEGLNHADTLAVFSPVFRGKATVLEDAARFMHETLG